MTERSGGDLAATKLRPPLPPTRFVDRTRLDEVLAQADATGVPVVLVSAPAGSGKSTLVAAWAGEHRDPVAWLQLDDSDADPARYWVSVVAAIGRVDAAVGEQVGPVAAGSLGSGQMVVPALVNAIAARSQRLVLVLDDYHLIDNTDVHQAMEQLIELCPPQLTLVLITRVDPPFRLGRMRVRGRLSEIRAGDLRFAPAEAAALLGAVADGLDSERLGELCERTEGWAAGLVLAGLSLERTDDTGRFIDTFRGDDHLVAGYLTDELLAVLGEDERRRLVEAAVLHRLCGPLIDAATGSTGGAQWLAALAARNQLVIRLDTVGEWYRFHHLFRDLLLQEARRSIPERLPELHRRAAAWFENAGYTAAAVDHLLAAGDRERAMYLMRFVGPDLLGSGRLRTLRNLLAQLSAGGPLDTICSILSGWDHYLTGRYASAKQLLDQAMATMTDDIGPMRAMPLRINLALGMGDVGTALAGAREVVAAGEMEARPSELTTAVGAAFTWAGLVDEARSALEIALVATKADGRITAHAMALVASAVAEFYGGDEEAARGATARALEFATTSGLGEYHGIAPVYAIWAAVGGESAGESPVADAERAVVLARRATTTLGLVFVLVVAGDVLVREGSERGNELLAEARGLIDACPDPGIDRPLLDRALARHRLTSARPAHSAELVEQLSERELAVLRYLPSVLSLPEIARELYVSPNTVKTQCSAIYRKLGVSGRAAAVQAAREHRLL